MTDLTGLLASGTEIIIRVLQNGLLDLPNCEFGFDGEHRSVGHIAFVPAIGHIPTLMGREDMLSSAIRSFFDFVEEDEDLRVETRSGVLTGMDLLLMFAEGKLSLSKENEVLTLRVENEARRGIADPGEFYSLLLDTVCRFGNEYFSAEVILKNRPQSEDITVSEGLTLSFLSDSDSDSDSDSEPEDEETFDEEPFDEEAFEEEPFDEEPASEEDGEFDFSEYELQEEVPGEFDEEPYDEEGFDEEPFDEEPVPEAEEGFDKEPFDEEPFPEDEEPLPEDGEPFPDDEPLTEREQNVRKNADAALDRIRRVFEDLEASLAEAGEDTEETGISPELPDSPEELRASFDGRLSFDGKLRMMTGHYSIAVPDGFTGRVNADGSLLIWKPSPARPEAPEASSFVVRETAYLPMESLGTRMSLSGAKLGDSHIIDAYVQLFDGVGRFRLEIACADAEAAEKSARELLGRIS